jgi:hypothetical protein
MTSTELLCYCLAFLIGILGGWELGGYGISRRAFDFLRDRLDR